MNGTLPEISVCVPVYNAAGRLEVFYPSLVRALEKTGRSFEMVFSDDGSTDGTRAALDSLARADARLRIVAQDKNRGQHAALSRAVAAANGKLLLLLDDDQSHMLGRLPEMLEAAALGHEAVFCRRRRRKIPFWRAWGSWTANLMVSVFVLRRLHDIGGAKIFAGRGADLLRRGGGVLGVLRHLRELNLCELDVEDGVLSPSRYNAAKLFRLFVQTLWALAHPPDRKSPGRRP